MMYTGIGSRQLPEDVFDTMKDLGSYFALKGYILRSGGAVGADTAFERGCDEFDGRKQIYLPWKQFNNNDSGLFTVSRDAIQLAKRFHKKADQLTRNEEKLHGRDVYQVIGLDMNTPSKFVVCWTPDGCEHHKQRSIITGGTGTAISIATLHKIPVFNLKNEDALERLILFLKIDNLIES